MTDTPQILEALAAIVGARNVLTDPVDLEAYLIDRRRRYHGRALCVVRPGSTAEVAAVVRLCAARGIAVTPQGGNSGLCGGATPYGAGPAIVIRLDRMNKVRRLSTSEDTITVEAGCILAEIQRIAAEADRLFPLSLSAEGTCQIGGNLSTNAGGVQVLRYGTARQLVLGLEVVLPDGEVFDGLHRLRKDNTGYDLKQLFIGAEGTLGIITAAVLRLFPKPHARAVAMAAVPDVQAALDFLTLARGNFGERVTSCEVISRPYMEVVQRHVAGTAEPFREPPPWYLLIEVTDSVPESGLRELLETTLAAGLERGIVTDAVVANSEAQATALWHLRHAVSEALRPAGPNMSHDTSVPLDRQPEFAAQVEARIKARYPEANVLLVGHLGDGNMHVVVLFAHDRFADAAAFEAATAEIDILVDDVAVALEGSITAEHGIGVSYRHRLARTTSPLELDLMRRIKRAIDPAGLMNPGKILLPPP